MGKDDNNPLDAAFYEDLAHQITVKGAGGEKGLKLNGKWNLVGTHNGRRKYIHKSGVGTLFFDQFWKISNNDNTSKYEYVNTTEREAECVPENMWDVIDPDMQPAPTVIDAWLTRWECVRIFRRLELEMLRTVLGDVINMLKDTKDLVRLEAINTLGRLPPKELDEVAPILIKLIEDEPKESVREGTIKVLGKLDPKDIGKYAEQIVPMMGDESSFVRLWALLVLEKLDVEDMEKYQDVLEAKFDGDNTDSFLAIREKACMMVRAHKIATGQVQEGDAC